MFRTSALVGLMLAAIAACSAEPIDTKRAEPAKQPDKLRLTYFNVDG
ncbi:MAG: hypothetical protein VYD05_05040 [Planctomycetota bacterium]|nr:hypothetical protein [Planctomycetota bacterium]MEC8651461.1 hypothetical protein [Planctomycetota bacterium]